MNIKKMSKKYPSKISYGLLFFVLLVMIAPLIFELYTGGISSKFIIAIGIISIPFAFILHLFFKTEYTIDDQILNIKCSFVLNENIDIASIKEISKTNSLISSPAPSLDRILIKYGKYNRIIISPRNKLAFAKDLTEMNPDIVNKISDN